MKNLLCKKLLSYFVRIKQWCFLSDTEYLYKYSGSPKFYAIPADIRIVTEKNVDDAASFQDGYYIDSFKRFLQEGKQGYYAYRDGECVHRSWVFTGEMRIHEFVRESLSENQIYIAWCETALFARGQGIYPQVLTRIVQDYTGKEIFIAAKETNRASRRGIEKSGFSLVSVYKIKRMFGKVTVMKANNTIQMFNHTDGGGYSLNISGFLKKSVPCAQSAVAA